MNDGLGNQITEGDKVVWVGGKTQYAGVTVYTVVGFTPKKTKIQRRVQRPRRTGETTPPKYGTEDHTILSTDLIVVTSLVN